MSDHQINLSEEQQAAQIAGGAVHTDNLAAEASKDVIGRFSGNLLERGDSIIYAIVGICFFLGGFIALGYSFWDFSISVFTPTLTPPAFAAAIIQLVSNLLLVLIIMEVLGTVTHYLKQHATSLRPFLFIGIVSATRGILSIGAKLSVESNNNPQTFNQAMIELGVNGAVILALGITLKLLGKLVED
jgi:uncharacterized membrane protein (DUF373 family)